jgi:hypothetical protein
MASMRWFVGLVVSIATDCLACGPSMGGLWID